MQWTSIKDSLPTESGYYVVCCDKRGKFWLDVVMFFCYREGSYFRSDWVTHWIDVGTPNA